MSNTEWQTYRNPHDPTDPEPYGPAESLPPTAPLAMPEGPGAADAESARTGCIRRRRRRPTAVVAVGALIFGAAWFGSGWFDATVTTEVTGEFNTVRVTAADVPVTVRYGEVARPQIVERHRRGSDRLQYNVVNSQLVIEYPDRGLTFGWSRESLDVILPTSMAGTTPDVQVSTTTGSVNVQGSFGSADVTAATGSIDVNGTFENVQARATTGSVDVRGTSPAVTAQTTTGSVDVRLDKATAVDARTNTGSVDVEVNGPQPDRIEARATTGSVDINVPDGSYHVQAKAQTGGVDIRVPQDPASPHQVVAETSTGSIDVR